jgi:hypothetical protein
VAILQEDLLTRLQRILVERYQIGLAATPIKLPRVEAIFDERRHILLDLPTQVIHLSPYAQHTTYNTRDATACCTRCAWCTAHVPQVALWMAFGQCGTG